MEYYHWQTMTDEFRRVHRQDKKRIRNLTDAQIKNIEMDNILSTPFNKESNRWRRMIRLMGENVWINAGKPYYNIHPQMVRSLCNTNLDKIPANLIEVPAGLEAVVFRFAEDVPTRYISNDGYHVVAADEVHHSPVYCRSVLFGKIKNDRSKHVAENIKKTTTEFFRSINMPSLNDNVQAVIDLASDGYYKDVDDFMIMCVDEGFRVKDRDVDRSLCNLITINCKNGQSVSEAIQTTVEQASAGEQAVMVTMGDRLSNLIRVIVSAGFLANCPEDDLVVPDILNADKQSFKDASQRGDAVAIQSIVERAKRRGKNGYNIGTSEMFVLENESEQHKQYDSTGKQLSFSHLRGGHPHAVRYGEGKNKVKIKWFRPTRVRPDLPFKTSE
jgi:hypothetical protein